MSHSEESYPPDSYSYYSSQQDLESSTQLPGYGLKSPPWLNSAPPTAQGYPSFMQPNFQKPQQYMNQPMVFTPPTPGFFQITHPLHPREIQEHHYHQQLHQQRLHPQVDSFVTTKSASSSASASTTVSASPSLSNPSTSIPSRSPVTGFSVKLPQPTGSLHQLIMKNNLYSESKLNIIGILAKLSTRPNAKCYIGAVDLGCSLVVTDPLQADNPIVYVSPGFEALVGYTFKECFGKNCRFLQAPGGEVQQGAPRRHCDPKVANQLRKETEEDQESQVLIQNYKKSGESFLNLVTIIPVTLEVSGGTDATFFVGLQCDINQISAPSIPEPQLSMGSVAMLDTRPLSQNPPSKGAIVRSNSGGPAGPAPKRKQSKQGTAAGAGVTPTPKKLKQAATGCIFCHSTVSPEWRRGPDGTKSLCNACGLRYAKISRSASSEDLTATIKKRATKTAAKQLQQALQQPDPHQMLSEEGDQLASGQPSLPQEGSLSAGMIPSDLEDEDLLGGVGDSYTRSPSEGRDSDE